MICMFGVTNKLCIFLCVTQVLLSWMCTTTAKGGKKIQGAGKISIVSKIMYVGLIGCTSV